jgi:hypothetical protein
MATTCPFRDMFGAPRTGAHSLRMFDFAVVDVAGTVLVAWLIAHKTGTNFWLVLLGAFITGIVAHRLFCVQTRVSELLVELSAKVDELR